MFIDSSALKRLLESTPILNQTEFEGRLGGVSWEEISPSERHSSWRDSIDHTYD
jgi:hypothetical protein